MNKHETTQITAETVTRDQESGFAVTESEVEEMEVVEFESAPLTDINFGF